MKLVILSNMAHFRRDGQIVGHGPTAREIDHIAQVFDEVVHVACMHDGPAPVSALPYTVSKIRLRGVSPAGGSTLKDKARIIRLFPRYALVMWQELRTADAVHVRSPANLSLLAILILSLRRRPLKRWIKYAGNWTSYEGEAWSYRIQRWLLNRNVCRSEVTINGRWANQPPHVHTFVNPCLTEGELRTGRTLAYTKYLTSPIRILFVGHLSRAKGVYEAIDVIRRLRDQNVPCRLTFVGDGLERERLESEARTGRMEDSITFAGGVPRTELGGFLAEAHIMLLPSHTEGWPKVLSEGMAYGAIPVASAVGSIPGMLRDLGFGVATNASATDVMANAIAGYAKDPARWRMESELAVAAASRFSYSAYVDAVRGIFDSSVRIQDGDRDLASLPSR